MNRELICPAVLMACTAGPAAAVAQDDDLNNEAVRVMLQRMADRIDALERLHGEDQKKIDALERRLAQVEGRPETPESRAQVEAIKEEVQSDSAATRRAGLLDLSAPAMGPGNALNPQITVFLDTGGSISTEGSNKALNRFNLREVELDIREAITPSVDGVLIVAIAEEIESEDGDIEIDRMVELEEGYLDFHTLPGDFALKVGKFRNAFGRNNLLHTHDLPQVTRPLVLETFLGPEGLSATGASLSWLVPNPWDRYVEAQLEVVNSDGGEESPLLGGPNAENPAVVGHLKFFDDLTETSSFEVGGSYLFGRSGVDVDSDVDVIGLDLTYHWWDPDPSTFRSWLFQTEALWGRNDVESDVLGTRPNNSFGAYAFAQCQIDQNWYVGLRGDYTEFPNDEARGLEDYDVALSPYVSWYISEFLRARLQYEHRWRDFEEGSGEEDAVFLQFTGVIGSHPPHPYWVRR